MKKKFDVIWAGAVLEHNENQGDFIRKCEELLKEDGKLIILVPNSFYIVDILMIMFTGKHLRENKVFEKIDGVYPSGHVVIHNENTLSQLLKSYNLKIIRAYYLLGKINKTWNPLKLFMQSIIKSLIILRNRLSSTIIIVAQKEKVLQTKSQSKLRERETQK